MRAYRISLPSVAIAMNQAANLTPVRPASHGSPLCDEAHERSISERTN